MSSLVQERADGQVGAAHLRLAHQDGACKRWETKWSGGSDGSERPAGRRIGTSILGAMWPCPRKLVPSCPRPAAPLRGTDPQRVSPVTGSVRECALSNADSSPRRITHQIHTTEVTGFEKEQTPARTVDAERGAVAAGPSLASVPRPSGRREGVLAGGQSLLCPGPLPGAWVSPGGPETPSSAGGECWPRPQLQL